MTAGNADLPQMDRRLQRLRELAEDVLTPGPWHYERSPLDGALVIYDSDGEAVGQVYGGLPAARYFVGVAPATLFADGGPE